MKPTKDNLKDELKYRVECLSYFINKSEENVLTNICRNEKSILAEVLKLIEIFENRIGYHEFEKSNYTPIKDYVTKEPLKIGDKVKTGDPFSNANGILIFDTYDNRYKIKTKTGGNYNTTMFIKISDNFDYEIDSSLVECRSNPNKNKW